MFCPKCGSEMPEGSRFCGECGFRIEANVPEQDFTRQEMAGYSEPVRENPGMEVPEQGVPGLENSGQRVSGSMEAPEKKKWKAQWTALIAVGVIAVGVAGGFLVKTLVDSNSEKESAQKQETEVLAEHEAEGRDGANMETEGFASADSNEADSQEAGSEITENPNGAQQDGKAPVETEESQEVPTEEPEPVEDDLPPTASLVLETPDVDNVSLFKLTVVNAMASSTIAQEGLSNDPLLMFDEQDDTSWQEGVGGYGVDETIYIEFDGTYEVEYLSFKLGNWKNDKYYFGNAKPKTMTFTIGDFTGQVTFTGDRTTEWVKLSKPVNAKDMRLVIDDVYPGTSWEDTCISEMGIYGF